MELMNTSNRKRRKYTTKKMMSYELSSDLLIDADYQRPLSEARVKRICEEFDEQLVNLIKVSLRDGKFYVFDGQHTLEALVRLNGGKPVMVDVMVYEFVGLTPAEQKEREAELFALQNGPIAKTVDAASRFRAYYEAKDPAVMQFHKITNSAGVLMDFTRSTQDRKLICYMEAWYAWRRLGNSLYVDMLKQILHIWGGDKDSFQAPIISGMSKFIKAYHDKYDRQILFDALCGESPLQIIKDAEESRDDSGHKFSRQILQRYNEEFNRKQNAG